MYDRTKKIQTLRLDLADLNQRYMWAEGAQEKADLRVLIHEIEMRMVYHQINMM